MSNQSQAIETRPGCIAAAMEVVGKKWTALILRDLMEGPKHFCELERTIDNITPRILSQRLDELQSQGILVLNPDSCYALTPKGNDLMPIIKQMASWGTKYPKA